MPETDERFALVVEGQCPSGHGPLRVTSIPGVESPPCGYCDSCRLGWSVHGGRLTTHLLAESVDLGTSLGRFSSSGGPVYVRIIALDEDGQVADHGHH